MAQSLCDSETVTEMGRLCFFTVLCSPGSSSLDAGFCPGPERRAARRCLILLPHLRSLPFHGTAITPAVLEKSSCSWPDTTMSGNGFSLSGKDMFYPLFFFFFSKPALPRVLKRLSATCLWFCQGSGYQAFSPRCRLWYSAELQMYLHPLPLVRSIQLCFLEGEPQNLG